LTRTVTHHRVKQIMKEGGKKMEKKLLNRKEAAKYLCLGVSTIDKFLALKRLKPVRLGRRVLFLKEDLDKFIQEAREGK